MNIKNLLTFYSSQGSDIWEKINNSINSQNFNVIFTQNPPVDPNNHKYKKWLHVMNSDVSLSDLNIMLDSIINDPPNKSLSLLQEFNIRRLAILKALHICIKNPSEAQKQDLPKTIKEKIYCPFVDKISNLMKIAAAVMSKIQSELYDFQENYMLAMFTSILYLYRDINSNRMIGQDLIDRQLILGTFLTYIGEFLDEIKYSDGDLISEFFIAAEHFNIITKPALIYLSKYYFSKGQHLKSLFYKARYYFTTTDPVELKYIKQELVQKLDAFSNLCQIYKNLMRSLNHISFYKLVGRNKQFILNKKGESYQLVSVEDSKTIRVIEHYYTVKMELQFIPPTTELYDIVYRESICHILILIVSVISNKSDGCGSTFESIKSLFIFLAENDKLVDLLESDLNSFTIVTLFSVKAALYDKQLCIEDNNSLEWACRLLFFSTYIISECFLKSEIMIKKVNYLRSLCLIFRCLGVFSEDQDFCNIVHKLALEDDLQFIPILFNYITSNPKTKPKNMCLRMFKVFGNSPMGITEDIDTSDKSNVVENVRFSGYLSYILFELNALLSKKIFFFYINSSNLCVFDFVRFNNYQIENDIDITLLKFTNLLGDYVKDARLTCFLYYFSTEIHREEELAITIPKYYIPDTNAFLVEGNPVTEWKIFNQLNFAIHENVLYELNYLKKNTIKDRYQVTTQAALVCAYFKKLINNPTKSIKMLRSCGTITEIIADSFNKRKMERKVDDQILETLLCLKAELQKQHVFKSNKSIVVRPFVFITDDNLFRLKVSASNITCIGTTPGAKLSEAFS